MDLYLVVKFKEKTMSAPVTPFAGGERSIQTGDSPNIDLVLIPAGEFWMGALPQDKNAKKEEKPRHRVRISRDFFVGKYPVTQKLYQLVMGSNLSHVKGDNLPVGNVSWINAVTFCNKLSKREGKEAVYTINGSTATCNWKAKGYRLLTEGEWKYAARGGEYHLYSGSDDVNAVAWEAKNSGRSPQPVGTKKPNGFGLYDMTGNVLEFCWDFYHPNAFSSRPAGEHAITTDPKGPEFGTNRVYCGGGWFYDAVNSRLSKRSGLAPTGKGAGTGFRIGLSR